MLAAIGLDSIEQLYSHLPDQAVLHRPLAIEPGKSEYEIVDYFKKLGERCATGYPSFLGAGSYTHYRPVMCDVVASRGEFLTSYTPYQAEMAQGTLTTIFEFQTMLCQLTGMDVANASMYDGSTAIPEAAMMAMRVTGRHKVLVSRAVHPEYRQVLLTYAKYQGVPVVEFGYETGTGQADLADLEAKLDTTTACVIIQSPNFFGCIEKWKDLAAIAHSKGALLVYSFAEAASLGILEPPRDADIVVGELQSFAHPPSYGGPYSGIIATKDKFVRQIPGRLVGETKDAAGRRAFCLTLSTREQHIRREKATSNICTNQALIALMGTVYMSIYGKEGLRELAQQNLSKAHYLAKGLKPRFSAPFFNEFVVAAGGKPAADVNAALLEKKIIGGLDLGRFYPELAGCMLLCATEVSRREHMDAVKQAFI